MADGDTAPPKHENLTNERPHDVSHRPANLICSRQSLETLKDGCVDVLEVSAAIATGGSSMAVTSRVDGERRSLQVDAWGDRQGEHDIRSTSLTDAFGDVLVDGAVAGTVGALLHDDGLVGDVTGEVSKKLGGTVLKKFGSDVAAKVAAKVVEKALKGGADKAAQKIVEDLVESFKPGSKMTLDKAVKDISEDFLKAPSTAARAWR